MLPSDGALIGFQRYEPFDGSKEPGERWLMLVTWAMVLRNDESIKVVDLGLAAQSRKRLSKR